MARRSLALLLLATLPCAHALAADSGLQALIDDALARGETTLRLPPGELRADGRIHVDDAEGLTISGPHTTIVFTNPLDAGFLLRNCSRVTLRGFTIDCDPLPFTQGTIASISDDRSVWDFEVHEGYPSLSEPYLAKQAYVYDAATGLLRRGVPDVYPRGVEALSDRRGRMMVNPATPGLDRVRVGDLIVLNIRDGAGVYLISCSYVALQRLTVLACPGIAFIGRYSSGENAFRRLTVRPGPPPAGATQSRLMSACADALNYAYATRGPLIERCRFRCMGDDSINLHGPTFAVCEADEGALVLGRPYGGEPYEQMVAAGAAIRGLRAGSFETVGEESVASFEREPAVTEAWRAQVQSLWPRVDVSTGSFFRVALREPLAVEVGDWVMIPTTAAPGFVIRNCEFCDHRARGMRIQASHGLIERNRLSGLQGAGISIGPEFGYWREAGWVEDLVVRGNTITDTGRGSVAQERWGFPLAAITVFGRVEPDAQCPPANRDIVLSGNTIDGCPTAGVSVTCARGVRVEGNRLEHTNYLSPDAGGVAGQPIEVERAQGVTVEGNEVTETGVTP